MRHFLEITYKGTRYSGFQAQKNADTIQGEIEKAFLILFRQAVQLTGSSRTDSGVHALQNFFHFDWTEAFAQKWIYHLNAILPGDIVIKSVVPVGDEAHCRFDALMRTYHYHIYQFKNPFFEDRSYYYPYTLDFEKLNQAARLIKTHTDFTSFSKRKTQVKNFNCTIMHSEWTKEEEQLMYKVSANRFLRGMVRALTATMLKVGRHILSLEELEEIIRSKDSTRAFFDAPAHGLTLYEVCFPKQAKTTG